MVDPTTTNKGFFQPARGADVGTWDTPMNANTSIQDNAFGGTATIALTNANVILSSAQYQCVFVNFTGALSASVAITLPNVGSFYTVQNRTSNSSAFQVTLQTTVVGGEAILCPPYEPFDIMTDATNVRFRSLGRVGTYWDYAGSSVPRWVSGCTIPPYLNCDGTTFSSVTYPALTVVLGGTTLPDSKGRYRLALDQGATRVTSAIGGIAGDTLLASGGVQVTTLSSLNMPLLPLTLTDPGHSHSLNMTPSSGFSLSAEQGSGAFGPIPNVILPSTTGITVTGGSSSPTAAQTLPPSYVGGLTLIRAA